MEIVGSREPTVRQDISPRDQMVAGNPADYFAAGRSALACIQQSMLSAEIEPAAVTRILDLPCGHGRVLRHLGAAFPDAEILACDLVRDGVDYCAQTFGATPVYSDEDPWKIPLARESVDLIWVGSLLTHLDARRWADFLAVFHAVLRPGGLLVFTTHGRRAYDWAWRDTVNYGLHHRRQTRVFFDYDQAGFGYGAYPDSKSYGVSFARPQWVFQQIERIADLRVVHFAEAAWARHQDVYACVRDPQWGHRHVGTSVVRLVRRTVRRTFLPYRE
jgi:SAM-dependent methyltransferase